MDPTAILKAKQKRDNEVEVQRLLNPKRRQFRQGLNMGLIQNFPKLCLNSITSP